MARGWKRTLLMVVGLAGGLGCPVDGWGVGPAEHSLVLAQAWGEPKIGSFRFSGLFAFSGLLAEENSRREENHQEVETSWTGPGTRSIRVRGEMGVDVWDRQAACQQAEQNAQEKLYQELGQWAEEFTGQNLSRQQLMAEHAWLLKQVGVQQTHKMQVEEKPGYWRAWQEITLSVPIPVLARWAERLQQQKQQRMLWLWGAIVGSVVIWLVGFWWMVRWDRATGGYYRTGVVLASVLILAILTGGLWWWVWGKL